MIKFFFSNFKKSIVFYNNKKIEKENKEGRLVNFNSVQVGLADKKKILFWSYGEVKNAETINYKNFKPKIGGLFCQKIFGPLNDYECLCKKYKHLKFKNIICKKCGIEIVSSKVRRERMGHVKLNAPIAHIWYLKSLPSRLGLILNMSIKNIENILYFKSYVVTNPGKTPLKIGEILSEKDYNDKSYKYNWGFKALMGAEGIKKLLNKINLKKKIKNLYEKLIDTKSEIEAKKILKCLKLFESFKNSNVKLSSMIINILPVLPPNLRPLVPLDGGKFASSDLNDLYRRIINRNNRLKNILNLNAPEIIIKNEKRMLQESVDSLLDNTRKGKIVLGSNKRPLKSLTEIIKGKTGRFRQNLLGKRVDYSGRTVIVVGPKLKLHQCGLPKLMALELFKPFIFYELKNRRIASNINLAKKIIKQKKPIIWKILNKIIKKHLILLNRAPTLHRLGIQAFKPILTDKKVIYLHPLVCTAFNADFDGDQMAVHVPLSIEAQVEARTIMLSSDNIFFPSNGEPSITPSQDIILGIYYATKSNLNIKNNYLIFKKIRDVILAYKNNIINISDKIIIRIKIKNKNYRYITTPGRVMLYNILPKGFNFSIVNKIFNKSKISKLIKIVYSKYNIYTTVKFVNKLMKLGFNMVTKSGISICLNDMITIKKKRKIVYKTQNIVKELNKKYLLGSLTKNECYNKILNLWDWVGKKISKKMNKKLNINYLNNFNKKNYINSIFMICGSGARGSEIQMKQLISMRGLMLKPSGKIIKVPVISSLKEGLSILEYFISTHGARKGLADTALKTANAGYLTRRLVDVAQNLVIKKKDCNTKFGYLIKNNKSISGRILFQNIYYPNSKKILYKKGILINEKISKVIQNLKLKKILIRSPINCEIKSGLCVKCYGQDLSRGNILVNIGEAIGVIAAQSIGEPGTQLTMRTFHIGGTANILNKELISSIVSDIGGKVFFSKTLKYIINKKNEKIVVSNNGKIYIKNKIRNILKTYLIPYGSFLLIKNNIYLPKGKLIAFWDSTMRFITNKIQGIVKYINIIEGVTVEKKQDYYTGFFTFLVIKKKENKNFNLKPSLKIISTKNNKKFNIFKIPSGSLISVKNNQIVEEGEILARIPIKTKKNKDIIGGLQRISELFEARIIKNSAILAEMSGKIILELKKNNIYKLKIINVNGFEYNYSLKKNNNIIVKNGQIVQKGDKITKGVINPKDILRLLGLNNLIKYIIKKIQNVYILQNVSIHDKHIEIIVRQMLRKVKIIEPGDSNYIPGELINRIEIIKKNRQLKKIYGNLIIYENILLGITKASLSTNSFISAASFQETNKILTEAIMMNKKDKLKGLKENVIMGKLIPAGTGFIKKYC